jgi:hypothetical protein
VKILSKCDILWPFGIDSFIQRHADRVLLAQGTIKDTLEEAMGSQWFPDSTTTTMLGPEFNRRKPTNVLWTEKHGSHDGFGPVCLYREASKNNLLDNHSIWIA